MGMIRTSSWATTGTDGAASTWARLAAARGRQSLRALSLRRIRNIALSCGSPVGPRAPVQGMLSASSVRAAGVGQRRGCEGRGGNRTSVTKPQTGLSTTYYCVTTGTSVNLSGPQRPTSKMGTIGVSPRWEESRLSAGTALPKHAGTEGALPNAGDHCYCHRQRHPVGFSHHTSSACQGAVATQRPVPTPAPPLPCWATLSEKRAP